MNVYAREFIKYNSVTILAALLTFLLFYFMQFLIALDDIQDERVNVIKLRDSTVPVFERELILDILKPEPIVEVETPEVRAPDSRVNPGAAPAFPTQQTVVEPFTLPNESIALSSNIMVPLIRTTANYPQRALARGIEGFVELSFTVDKLGSVVDPVILYSVPEGVFDRSALQSIAKWKYSPAVEGGEPVPTYDVRQRIVFQMQDSQ